MQGFTTSGSAGVRSNGLGQIVQPLAQAVIRGAGTQGNAVSIRADAGGAEIVTGAAGLTTDGTSGPIKITTTANSFGALELSCKGLAGGRISILNNEGASHGAITLQTLQGGIRLAPGESKGISMPLVSNNEATNNITCNGVAGIITTKNFSGDPDVANDTKTGYEIKVNNTTCLAVTSIVLVSINSYAGSGTPVVRVKEVAAGNFTLTVSNASSWFALNAAMKIAFLVINE